MTTSFKVQRMPCAAHRHPDDDGDNDASAAELLLSSDEEKAGEDVQADRVERQAPDSLPEWPHDMELGATWLPSAPDETC